MCNHGFCFVFIGTIQKVENLAKLKDCEVIRPWIPAIRNHIYWVAKSSGGQGDLLEAKWTSLLNHIQNVHDHQNPLYLKCEHGDLNAEERPYKWLEPG